LGEVLLEAGEKLAEGLLAACEKRVSVFSLRRSGPGSGLGGKSVVFYDDDVVEIVGDGAGGGETSQACADDDCLFANASGHGVSVLDESEFGAGRA
jgi:hypothetical protein